MGRRKRAVIAGLITLAGLGQLAVPHSSGAAGWRVVKSKSVSGQFATTALSATVNHPHGLAMRLTGNVSTGFAAVACSRGFSISSNSRQVSRSGTFSLQMMRAADSCEITASVGGSGRVSIQLLKL